ncbi:MAG TPA: hypothetical protein VF618_00405 [Thermoanaerobaculia bacterium]
MTSATSALYEPLIERDLDAIDAAVRAFRTEHSTDELFLAVTRFAVLAFAPTMHAKHALLACLAVHDVGVTDEWLIECARYIAASRLPWSEPPMLDPPQVDAPLPLDELRAARTEGNRLRGERWLASNLETAGEALLEEAQGLDAMLVVRGALRLAELLGEKGRYAALRVAVWELVTNKEGAPGEPLEVLVARAAEERGSIEAVHAVFVKAAENDGTNRTSHPSYLSHSSHRPPAPYRLARDYAHTLIAHALAPQIPNAEILLAAVHQNRENGPDFEEWSFA